MPVTEESVVIDKPVDEVFAFFADPENAPVYMTNVMDYELVSGEGGKEGSVSRATVKVAGRRIELTEELARVEPGRAQHRRSVKSPIRYETVYRFEPVETGTRVTFHQDTEDVGNFFGRFTQPVVEKLYARDVRNNLEHAKQLLEEGDTIEGGCEGSTGTYRTGAGPSRVRQWSTSVNTRSAAVDAPSTVRSRAPSCVAAVR